MAVSLRFPDYPDVRLRRSPLSEVICQVRFPPILKITSETPIAFQDAIRHRFPQFDIEQEFNLRVQDNTKPEGLVELAGFTYRFKSQDEQASATLRTDFFALITKHYNHWSGFKEDFKIIQNAAVDAYHPAYANRIGLRFINRFTFENTQTANKEELLGLFRSQLVCLIGTEAWDEPQNMAVQMLLDDETGNLSIRTRFIQEKDEPVFLLDFDYFKEGQLPFDSLEEQLDHFHRRIYQAFRWSLTEGSFERFDPIHDEG
jgi:uncharacterized protein (TIGR04255 family)